MRKEFLVIQELFYNLLVESLRSILVIQGSNLLANLENAEQGI